MRTSKDEIAKINKMRKILTSVFDEEEILKLKTNLIFKENKLYIWLKENGYFLQTELDVEDIQESRFTTTFEEILNVAKTFTKKTEIDIKVGKNTLIFSGNQDKEEKSIKIKVEENDSIKYSTNIKGFKMESINFLNSLLASYKLAKKMEYLDIEELITVSIKNNKLNLFSNSSGEILHCNIPFDGDEDKYYLEKDKIKFIYTLIQETKAFEITFNNYKGIVVIADDYQIHVDKANKKGLDLEGLVENLEKKLNFVNLDATIDEKEITLRNNEERIVYVNDNLVTAGNINEIFSNISKIDFGYSNKRITELLKIKSIDIDNVYKSENNILKFQNEYLEYYLLPQKKTN